MGGKKDVCSSGPRGTRLGQFLLRRLVRKAQCVPEDGGQEAVGRSCVNRRGFVVEKGRLAWILGEEPPGWAGTAGLLRAGVWNSLHF